MEQLNELNDFHSFALANKIDVHSVNMENIRFPFEFFKSLGLNIVGKCYGIHHNRTDGEWNEYFFIEIEKSIYRVLVDTNIYNQQYLKSDILDSIIEKTGSV